MISSTKVPGLSLLTARPGVADDAAEPDAFAALFIEVCERLLGTYDRVVVASPPPVDGLQAARLLVVPSQGGRCDVIGGVITPLKVIGLRPDGEIADAPDLLVATLVPGEIRRNMIEAAPAASAPRDDGVPTTAVETEPDDVVPRLYYLSAEAIGSLRVFSSTLSDRLGRHVTLSEIVSIAIRTSPVLDQAERLGDYGAGQARIFHLRRSTLTHLTQLALLASRALGRHVRLSEIVDLSLRLHCAQPLERQVELLEGNRRKRENRA